MHEYAGLSLVPGHKLGLIQFLRRINHFTWRHMSILTSHITGNSISSAACSS